MADSYRTLDFKEASDYLRGRLENRLPTRRWNDIERGMHARAFVVAGATKDALIADLGNAIMKVQQGEGTLQTFRSEFEQIVARHGWTGWKGEDTPKGRAWRTRVMLDTNLRTAYAAGRYKQLTDPQFLKLRPFWRYRHSDFVRNPRKQHVEWDGLVLRADDDWWKTHYPPCDWGCHCYVDALSARDLPKLKKTGPDEPPPSPIDPKTGAPVGIGKGWDYNVGEAAWGNNIAGELLQQGAPEPITPWRPADYPQLPARLTPAPAPVEPLSYTPRKREDLVAALPRGIYTDPTGGAVNITEALIDHWLEDPALRLAGRQRYLPLMPYVIEQPVEVWLSFVRFPNGRVEVLRRYIAAYSFQSGDTAVGLVADFIRGQWVALTGFPEERLAGGALRSGRLLWSRDMVEGGGDAAL